MWNLKKPSLWKRRVERWLSGASQRSGQERGMLTRGYRVTWRKEFWGSAGQQTRVNHNALPVSKQLREEISRVLTTKK